MTTRQRNDVRGRISAMTMLFVLLSLILSLTVDAQAQTFTRGQWTNYGSGSYDAAVSRGDGTIKDYQGNIIPSGTAVGNWGGGGISRSVFANWSQAGIWDTTNSRWVSQPSNTDFSSNDMNWFSLTTGTWNNGGRLARSFSEFAMNPRTDFASQTILFGLHPQGPEAFVDWQDHYLDIATTNASAGHAVLPSALAHTDGNGIWMPSVGRFAWLGGRGGYWNDFGGTFGVWEFDPVTKKWSYDITGKDRFPAGDGGGCAAWDSKRNRGIRISPKNSGAGFMFAYDPAAALGSRVTMMTGVTIDIGITQYPVCVYDSKRDLLRVYASFPQFGGAFAQFEFSSNGGTATAPRISGFRLTGTLGWQSSMGVLYDPVADKDVAWFSGTSFSSGANPAISGDSRTMYVIDPVSHVSATYLPSGAMPDRVSSNYGGSIPSVWSRWAYLQSLDVYAVIPDAYTSGVSVFAPDRTSGPLASTRGR